MRNRGQVPLRDLSVQVLVGQPVATRSELAGLVAAPGGPTLGLDGLDSFAPPDAEVAPGATLRLERRRVAVPPELGAGSAGAVLPLSVRVQASGPGPLTARLGTFAIWLPARPDRPLRAALLVPFHEPPHRNSSGEFVDDRLAELLGPTGPLGAAAAVVARPGAPRLTMVVDGLLVEEATAMAASWTLRQGGTSTVVPADDPRSRGASVTASVCSAKPYAAMRLVARNPARANLPAKASSVAAWIGSAPQPATRHDERLSPSSSDSFTRRTHIS